MSGASWSLIGSVGLQGLTVLVGIIVARIVGKHVFGQWGIIMSAALMFGSLGGLGMATAAAKYVAELKRKDPLRAGRILSLIFFIGFIGVSITSVTCFALARLMSYSLYNAPELLIPLRFTSLMLFCLMGSVIMQGIMAGFEDFKGIARISMTQGVFLFIALIILTYFFGLVGAVVAMTASHFIAICFYLITIVKACKKYGIRISTNGMWKESRIIWHYAAPGFLTSCVLHPAKIFSHAIVANTQGGFAGLGGYNASERWQSLVLFIPRAVKRITLPMLSQLQGGNDYKRFQKALWANIALNGGLALLVAIPIMILSPFILQLYGPDFRDDWDILIVLVGVGVFQAVIEVLSQVLVCMEKMWFNFAFHVIYGTILLGGSYLMVPKFGVRGYMWAFALTTSVHLLNHIVAVIIFVRGHRDSINVSVLMKENANTEE